MTDKKAITTYREAVAYIESLPRFSPDYSLETTKEFLHRLGDPDRKLKIIHVAGTNGKGSVCAYLRYGLESGGYRVAVFTSPHLVDIRERFCIRGKMVEEQTFLDAFLQVYECLEQMGTEAENTSTAVYAPTFSEYLFFMAMIIFSTEVLDYCILETGLGGRLDATNAVGHKELSVITRISLDHVEWLGDTIAEIAQEKAGIMQAGAPVVFTDASPEASAAFCKRASELGITAYSVSKKDYAFLDFQNKTIDFSLRTGYYGYVRFTLHTIARYQMENAALAVRAIEVLDEKHTIGAKQLRDGLATCVWPGRMEEILPGVYVDGAHNEDGIRAFLDTVREDGCEDGRSLLFSVVQDKDYEHMIVQVAASGLFDRIAIAGMHTKRAASVECLAQMFEHYPSCHYKVYTKVDEALQALLADRREKERVYIAGSLYLVGEIKEFLEYD